MKDRYKAQRTAPGPSVGAGGEQSVADLIKPILADEPDPINAVFQKHTRGGLRYVQKHL